MADVLLVTMPWDMLGSPSLALGILHRLLRDGGLTVATRSLKLRWMEHLLANQRRKRDVITLEDYEDVACHGGGLGDWVFAEPPIAARGRIAEYGRFLRTRRAGAAMRKLLEMRRLAPGFLDRCAEEILAAGPRAVGFTTTFCQNLASLALARRLKEARPDLPIVFGGANCEGPMGAALHRCFPWIDVVVRGEGEAVAPPLFRALVAGEPVPRLRGLCVREDGRSLAIPQGGGAPVAMDAVPAPDYDDYFAELAATSVGELLRASVFLSYESARGCWWGEVSHCTFCGLNGANMTFRAKSPARVLDDVVGLARRYQVLDLHAVDNILDLGYFDTFLPAVERSGLDLQLFYEVKSNLKKRQVARLKRAGVTRIQPGIESLSTPILKLMGKGVTAWQNLRLLKWCAQAGIAVEWNLIYGFPGEPEEAYRSMAELLPSLWHLAPPRAEPIAVHRYSPYHQRPEAHGLRVTGPAWYYRFLYDVDERDATDLAYELAHEHVDGRRPERYTGGFRRAVARWRQAHDAGATLTFRRGPGFVQIRDGRAGRAGALVDLTLEGPEAAVYLACDDGARLPAIAARASVSEAEAARILETLAGERLIFREDDRFLGLALPAAGGLEEADEELEEAPLISLTARAAGRR